VTTTAASGRGHFGAVVWPAYAGVCVGDPGPGPIAYGEPEGTDYRRGQIQWAMEDGEIVGRAFVNVGVGSYTHAAYFSGPEGPRQVGKYQFPHPIRFPRPGVIELYPITNPSLRLNKAQGIDY